LSNCKITPRESGPTSLWSFVTKEFEKPTQEARQMTAVATPAGAVSHETVDWHAIDWRGVHRIVRRLQARIVKATQAGRWGKVNALQHLLTHSFSSKALAVKRVTENSGKRTPGVDGDIWDSPAKKTAAIGRLHQRGYKPVPLRRVWIPKSHSLKLRPLSIPSMRDRAMQALYLLALDPIAETTADRHSYGFRSERCTADALEQCRVVLCRKISAPWILEGDIQSCFDKISHDWLLANVPMDRQILRQWLQAGFIEKHVWHPTDAGTPQGGTSARRSASW
jgi:RNA-directed DNA polymerase